MSWPVYSEPWTAAVIAGLAGQESGCVYFLRPWGNRALVIRGICAHMFPTCMRKFVCQHGLRPSRNLCIERCVQRSPQCPVSIPRPWGNTAIESARADKDFLCQQVDCSSVFGLLNHGNHEIHEPRETMGNWKTMATEALTSPVSPRSGTRGF